MIPSWLGALGLLCIACNLASGDTIIKLGLGGDVAFDVSYDGTELATIDDGSVGSDGDQDTGVDFLGFLSSETDISFPDASFTIAGVSPSGLPVVSGGGFLVEQGFTGGMFWLYKEDGAVDELLLSADLDDSTLFGVIGGPSVGSLFTTSFATVTGGTLAPLIDPDSIGMAISFTNVNGGAGFSTSGEGAGLLLNPFVGDVTLNIEADQIPEPATSLLALWAGLLTVVWTLRSGRAKRLAG